MTRRAAALVALLLCAACGLPSSIRADARRASDRIDAENADIARKEARYRAFAASSAFAQDQVYADREGWARQFDYARVKTAAARAAYQRDIAPLLRRNVRRDEGALSVQLAQIARLLSEAGQYADRPDRRRGYIDDVARTYGRLARDSADTAARMPGELGALLALGDKTRAAFPARAADIAKRVDPVQRLAGVVDGARRKVAFETANADGRRAADFVVLGDNAQLVSRSASQFREETRTVSDQLNSLSKSYSKALSDMKAQYYITVQRWAWNESADYPPTHTYTYPRRELSGDAFDYFNSLPDSLPYAARLTSSWFGASVSTDPSVDAGRWSALGLAPKENWIAGDDSAEFGYTLSADYFHQNLVTDDGQAQETDWQPVDETMFEDHVDDLGMDLVSKPFGAFEDEKIANPTPAGLAFVGNPQYGRWQTDDRGGSFWEWYGRYRLFSDLLGIAGRPYYYRQDEWNTWSTRYRGQPYYGEDKDKNERYGTRGYVVGSSARYGARIPEMRRVATRHGADAIGGRGGLRPSGK